jgi:hypothetical protein
MKKAILGYECWLSVLTCGELKSMSVMAKGQPLYSTRKYCQPRMAKFSSVSRKTENANFMWHLSTLKC